MFSNKEQKVYLEKYIASPANRRINGITAKIRCRPCSGEQVNERQCEGPCGEWKALDKFSKSQRTRGSGWCQECVLWKEAAEPGVVTEAAPNTMLAPDELDLTPETTSSTPVIVRRNYSSISYSGDTPEYGDGSDSDDDYNYRSTIEAATTHIKETPYAAMEKGLANLHMRNPTISAMGTQANTATPSSSMPDRIPPHLRTGMGSAIDTPGYVPPHMRGLSYRAPRIINEAAALASEVSSVSNPYTTTSESVGPGPAWSAVDTRRRVPDPITFNGFDNTGKQHIQQRELSGAISAVAPPTTIPVVAPIVAPISAPSATGRRANWAKPVSYTSLHCIKACKHSNSTTRLQIWG